MLKDELNRLEQLIKTSKNLEPERQQELINLAERLRRELNQLAETAEEDAKTISGHVHQVAHTSLQDQKDETMVASAADHLKQSVREFEVTHPALTRVIQQICIAFGV